MKKFVVLLVVLIGVTCAVAATTGDGESVDVPMIQTSDGLLLHEPTTVIPIAEDEENGDDGSGSCST